VNLFERTSRGPHFGPEQGPIVVGGVGGSGTRVVAQIMRRLGVYTGSSLNKAGDNKWFTLLCKLPRFDLEAGSPDATLVARSLSLLERAMTGQISPQGDRRAIADVVERCRREAEARPLPDDRPPEWLREIAVTLRRSRQSTPEGAPSWGWKEPNSHLLLPHLQRQFSDRLRYVHVIRNGVYMAHSHNQAQVSRWGQLFGLHVRGPVPTPQDSLDYWIAANELAIGRGLAMPPEQFLVVNYDELCERPLQIVPALVEFLGFDPPTSLMDELVALPRAPARPPLTRDQMEFEFGPERLMRVRELGFSLEDAA
jgi:hypothetical protein